MIDLASGLLAGSRRTRCCARCRHPGQEPATKPNAGVLITGRLDIGAILARLSTAARELRSEPTDHSETEAGFGDVEYAAQGAA